MGVLRRVIRIAGRPDQGKGGEVRAALEDDFHHFRVSVRHAAGQVTGVESQTLRFPTVLCPAAGDQLRELEGMALHRSSAAAMEQVNARLQCTHMIDLAGLAVAAAATQVTARRYEAEAPDRQAGQTRAVLRRDGQVVLAWDLDGDHILGPEPFASRDIGSGFTGWARSQLGEAEAEAALVLRRVVFISGGRGRDLDSTPASRRPIGGCWAWQPERADQARRIVGSSIDFTDRADRLTADDSDWLAGC